MRPDGRTGRLYNGWRRTGQMPGSRRRRGSTVPSSAPGPPIWSSYTTCGKLV